MLSTKRSAGLTVAASVAVVALVGCAAKSPRSGVPQPARRGLTFGLVAHFRGLGTDLVSCHGAPRPEGGDCNPHQGDTLCTRRLPVLCVRPDGSPRPPYAVVGTDQAMAREYYQGWAGGRIGLTRAVRGTDLQGVEGADFLCQAALGQGYRMAEFHDGMYVEGMDGDRFHGDSWTRAKEHASGGWAFHAYGNVSGSTRFWVRINDTRANCWDD